MSRAIPPMLRLAEPVSHPGQDYARRKRYFDLALVLASLPVTVPLLLLCALAVRLSGPGPILFKQHRTGAHGQSFAMYKFRSMVSDADKLRDRLKAEHAVDGPDFKLLRDPRVTPIGAVMRKLSLDELPQLWNIIRGDMTLVGPRPSSFGAEDYELWHTERLDASPGLTGLWQVEKRGDLDFDARSRLDIAYLRNRSLRLDLWILLRTVPAVLKRRGAY